MKEKYFYRQMRVRPGRGRRHFASEDLRGSTCAKGLHFSCRNSRYVFFTSLFVLSQNNGRKTKQQLNRGLIMG